MKDQLKNVFLRSWSPAEKGLLLVDVLLSGVLLGWLTSPFRKVAAGNAAKIFVDTFDEDDDDDEDDDEDDDDEDEDEEDNTGDTIEIEIEKQ